MKLSFCLVVFALCLAAESGLSSAAPSTSADSQTPLKRVARQMPQPPPPPEMPQMPGMLEASVMYDNIAGIAGATTRNKREAKGGGAMPTRKG